MPIHRHDLPQRHGGVFLTDGGLETDLIFNHGFDIPAFAAHTLLESEQGTSALARYFGAFLALAGQLDCGFVLDAPTWRAQRFFAAELGCEPEALAQINRDAVAFSMGLRRDFATNREPIVISAAIGPRGDAYAPEQWLTADEATRYHHEQLSWLADTDIDMVTALTFTHTAEAIGIVRAASTLALPIAVSFTVETDGRLPSGQTLADAISEVDEATDRAAQYFMLNCAHPSHFVDVVSDTIIRGRVRGLRSNASTLSHAELDCCETLDAGDPDALARDYESIRQLLPKLTVFGGCCGTDIRHVTAIAKSLSTSTKAGSRRVIPSENGETRPVV